MRMIEEASRANRAGGRQKKSCIRKYEMRHQFKFSWNEHLKLTIVYKQERVKGLPMTNLVHRKYISNCTALRQNDCQSKNISTIMSEYCTN